MTIDPINPDIQVGDLISGFRDYQNLSHQDRVRRIDFYQDILSRPINIDIEIEQVQELALNNI